MNSLLFNCKEARTRIINYNFDFDLFQYTWYVTCSSCFRQAERKQQISETMCSSLQKSIRSLNKILNLFKITKIILVND